VARPKTRVAPVRRRWLDHDLDVLRSRVIGYRAEVEGVEPFPLRETWREARADLSEHEREHRDERSDDAD
jgi:hypothetical protein